MCDPVSIGALALSAAGSAIQGREQNANQRRAIEARNAVTQQELERQRAYGDQTRSEFDKSLNLYDPSAISGGLTTAQGGITDALTRNAPTADTVGTITTGYAPPVIGNNERSKIASVFARGADQSRRTGALKGYDQQLFDNNLATTQNGRNIDVVRDLSKTSSDVAGTELGAADTNARRPSSGLGQLLQFAGNAGAYYGGRGGFGATPAATGSTLPYGGPLTSQRAIY